MTKRFDGLASIATTVLLATVPCTASAQLVASVAAGPVAAQGSGIQRWAVAAGSAFGSRSRACNLSPSSVYTCGSGGIGLE